MSEANPLKRAAQKVADTVQGDRRRPTGGDPGQAGSRVADSDGTDGAPRATPTEA